MCDLRLNSLGENLHPISLSSPGGGAQSEWSSLTEGWPIGENQGSLRFLGFPGPLWPGKGLLYWTQGDCFSGWSRIERSLGRRTSPVMLSVALRFSPWEEGAPTVKGATGVLARTPCSPFYCEGAGWTMKAGAAEKNAGQDARASPT